MSIQVTIEDALTHLCRPGVGNFYAFVISPLRREYTKAIPTFCVTVRNGRYTLMVNPDFAHPQSFERTVMILEHEVLHIVLSHCPRGYNIYRNCESENAKHYFRLASPIAVDMAVNEFVRKNHSGAVLVPACAPKDEHLPENAPAVLCEDYGLPPGLTYEDYYLRMCDLLQQEVPDPEQLIQEIVESLRKEIEEAGGAQPGSLLHDVMQKINEKMGEGEGEGEGEGGGGDGGDGGDGGEGGGGGGEGESQSGSPSPRNLRNQVKAHVRNAILEHLFEYLEDMSDPATGDHLNAQGRTIVRGARDKYAASGRGTLPSYLGELIDVFLRPPTVSWKELFRALIMNALKVVPMFGYKRVSKLRAAIVRQFKRKGYALARRIPLFPGTELDDKFTIIYVMDTSGSMGYDDLAAGFAEIQHIQKSANELEIYVLHVDAAVAKIQKMGPYDVLDSEAAGRGGTDFETAFAYIKENYQHVDLVVYATDGYAPAPTTQLACPTVWLLTPSGHDPIGTRPGHYVLRMQEYPA